MWIRTLKKKRKKSQKNKRAKTSSLEGKKNRDKYHRASKVKKKHETKSWFFEKFDMVDKPLARLTKK